MKKAISIFISLVILITSTGLAFSVSAAALPSISINAIAGRPGGFAVSWKRKSGISGYQIQYSTSNKFPSGGYKLVKIENPNCYGKTVNRCMSNRKYYVRLRTYRNVRGKYYYSKWSSAKAVNTRHKNEANPTNITSISAQSNSINITWRKEATAGGYQIQYSTDSRFPSNNCTYLYIDGTNSTSKTIKDLKTDRTYYVRIRTRKVASGKRYYSAFSSVKSVKLPRVAVSSVAITDPKGLTVEKGRTIRLHAAVSPSYASNKGIIWSTSDKTKATVDQSGLVTAIRPTEYVLITATSKDGGYVGSYELKITANTGYLTKADLDKLNLKAYNSLMIVAHPDDETLWGGSHLLNGRYFVVVLTNSYKDLRKSEFREVMKKTNDRYIIMSYPDLKNTWYDKNGKYKYSVDTWSTCKTGMEKDLELILNYKQWKTIVTHNPNGEYGHYHHKRTSSIVSGLVDNTNKKKNLFYFGNFYKKNEKNPEKKLASKDYKLKDSMVETYVPSSPNAIANNRHMVPYENWIPASKWNELKR